MAQLQQVRAERENFELEAELPPGEISDRVIEELRHLRNQQNEAAAAYREGVKVQAEKHKLKPSALRRFVNALAADKLDAVGEESRQLVQLIDAKE